MSVNALNVVKLVAVTHFAVSTLGIVRSAYATPPNPPYQCSISQSNEKIRILVSRLYSGKLDFTSETTLTEKITFEDPIALCVGRKEVHECFRALHDLTSPCHVIEPTLMGEYNDNSSTQILNFYLHQRYFGCLEVVSVVDVEVGVSDGKVKRIEERWNNIALFKGTPAIVGRRFNGILSGILTPLF